MCAKSASAGTAKFIGNGILASVGTDLVLPSPMGYIVCVWYLCTIELNYYQKLILSSQIARALELFKNRSYSMLNFGMSKYII